MLAIFIYLLLTYPTPAASNETALGLVHHISLDVNDEVTGNCWTNVKYVKDKARLELQRSNISIIDYSIDTNLFWFPILSFWVSGERNNFGCLWNASMEVHYFTVEDTLWADGDGFRFVAYSVLWQDGAYGLASPNANQSISSFFDEAITRLLLRIEQEKKSHEVQRLKDLFPQILVMPSKADN